MSILTYKNPQSELRQLVKIFKVHFDDPTVLRRYEPALLRMVFLSPTPLNRPWRAEALHRLALWRWADGNMLEADKYFRLAHSAFADHDFLGIARLLRDYGLFVAETEDPKCGLSIINQAKSYHDDDSDNPKGSRQRRITNAHELRIRLLVDRRDRSARESLIAFALSESRDCSLRDQQQTLEFLIPRTRGLNRQLLVARHAEVSARRRKPYRTVRSMAKFAIDIPVTVATELLKAATR